MRPRLARRMLAASAVCALVGLALMVWSLFDDSPLVLVASMTLGQTIGTLCFLVYGAVVISDLWRARLSLNDDEQET